MVLAAAIVVAGVTLLVLAVSGGRGGKASSTATTTATTAVGFLPGRPGGSVEPDTTIPPPPSISPSTAPLTAPPTSVFVPAPAPAPVPTVTTVATVAECSGADLLAVTTTDRLTYETGEPVNVTVTVRNNSGRPCQVTHPFPVGLTTPILVMEGSTLVWRPDPSTNGVIVNPRVLDAGGSYQWATALWNQRGCVGTCGGGGGAQVAPGIYRAVADHPPGTGVSAVFTIKEP